MNLSQACLKNLKTKMALNAKTFGTRTLTAIIFVAVMLAGLLWNVWSFFLLMVVIQTGAWLEYQRLLQRLNPDYDKIISMHRYGIIAAGLCILLYFTNSRLWIGSIRLVELGFWGGVLLMILLPLTIFFGSRYVFVKNMGQSVFGLLYISLPLGLLVDIRMTLSDEHVWGVAQPLFLVLFIIASLWINDTMAYITGSLIGKTPLSSVSPKKTIEGTVGGALLCIGAMTWIGTAAGISAIDAITISSISAVAGTFGDLFESKLKRMASVKDSGSIMPGHGGFLDRFDSLFFAATCVWFYLKIRGLV